MVAGSGSDRDGAGRRYRRTPSSTGKRVTLQERDWLWLEVLHEHGPLASSFLLAFAARLGMNEKRARERLTDLFNEDNTADGGPYLSRPPQQFHTLDSRYNQLVYDLAPAGVSALKKRGRWHETAKSTGGPWLHRFMTSSITASIHLAANEREDLLFIAQTAILERADTVLSYPVTVTDPVSKTSRHKDLKPDAIFGLEYKTNQGARYRFFVVEADRSTEPYQAKNFNRKSVLRNYLQYREYVGNGAYQKHLKLTAPLLVLNVCSDPKRAERMREFIADQAGRGNTYQLFRSWEDFGAPFRPPHPDYGLLKQEWKRASLPDLAIDQP